MIHIFHWTLQYHFYSGKLAVKILKDVENISETQT